LKNVAGEAMDKEYFNILILGHTTFGMRRLRIRKERFKIGVYLLAFLILSLMFFFCDYIQVRKKTFLLNQLRQEAQVQKSHIQLFSAKVEGLEKKLTRLKEFDRRIRTIANLEGSGKTTSFIAMGGSSSPGVQETLEDQGEGK
jgi:phosphopantetheine adenylyltransferase